MWQLTFNPNGMQQVSRLLTIIYVLSTSLDAFSISPDEALSQSQWASFFHQASIGSHFNQQLVSSMMKKPKAEGMMDVEVCVLRYFIQK